MAQQFEYDDEDDYTEDRPDEGSNLVKQLRQQLKEREKSIRELTERLTVQEKSSRERTIADALAAKGVNPKVAKLIPSDVEANAESIDQWVNDYADVFNIQIDASAADEVEPDPDAGAYDRMRRVEEGSTASANTSALEQKIASAGTQAELLALLASGGR